MSDEVSVILAVSTPVVALGALASALLQHYRTLKHDRRMRDLSDVREVLYELAAGLADIERDALRLQLSIGTGRPDDVIRRQLESMSDALIKMRSLLARLGVLIAVNHEIVRTARAAHDSAWCVIEDAGSALGGDDVTRPNRLRDALGPVTDHTDRLADEKERVLRLATDAVGARLPQQVGRAAASPGG